MRTNLAKRKPTPSSDCPLNEQFLLAITLDFGPKVGILNVITTKAGCVIWKAQTNNHRQYSAKTLGIWREMQRLQ
jgi:hypothetical protein